MLNLLKLFFCVFFSCVQLYTKVTEYLICVFLSCIQFYAKVTETLSWLNDKHSLIVLQEYGKDEDSTQALIKKHEAIELDIEGYRVKIDELSSESQTLVEGGNFDSTVISERQVSPCNQSHKLSSHLVFSILATNIIIIQ